MVASTINASQRVFQSKQTPVVCTQYNVPRYPANGYLLAPSTDVDLPTYSAGRILATYGSDAPEPEMEGMKVNWDPTSSVASQAVPTDILSDEFVHNLLGVDLTTTETFTATCNRVNCTPLGIGLALYSNAIEEGNTPDIVTAFYAAYTTTVLGESSNTNNTQNVISIQSVAS